MKIAYFGYDIFFDCLIELHTMGHEIMKIFTVKTDNIYEFSCKIRNFATKFSIPLLDTKIRLEELQNLEIDGCELIVCAGYFYRIPIEQCGIKGINVHPALLPVGRGPWPMPVTILKGLEYSGVTIHAISSGIDEGDILTSQAYKLELNENLETMVKKIQHIAPPLLCECVKNIDEYMKNVCPQNEYEAVGEYWKEPTVDEMTFDVNTPIEHIDKIIRAFTGYGSIFNSPNGKIVVKYGKCLKGNIMPQSEELHDGVYKINGGYLQIFNSLM